MPGKVTLLILEQHDDYNFEREYFTPDFARQAVERFKRDGGYWTTTAEEEEVFVPWHQVDFCRIKPLEDGTE